ncbi:MAG: DUF547 domain-containing protein [Balneolaceae bacterium]
MKQRFLFFISMLLIAGCNSPVSQENEVIKLSSNLLLEVKRSNPTTQIENELANLDKAYIVQSLNSDNKKKTFWLNIYNAYYQIIAEKGGVGQDSIFIKKLIPVAGEHMSFDELEHGILRAKDGYDYKDLAVDTVDYRIHFALNCGAKSCPPIAFYDFPKIDDQLEAATKLYLTLETELNEEEKVATVTQLMEWFGEDFGGEENLPSVLTKYLDRDLSDYSIRYKEFDWTEKLSNFSSSDL